MNDLDKKLKDWGAEATPKSPLSDQDFAAQVVASIRENPPKIEKPEPKRFPLDVLLAVAATVAVAAIAIAMLGQAPNDSTSPVIAHATEYQGLSTDDLAEIKTVANEINNLFPDGVRWISKVNGELKLAPGEQQHISTTNNESPRILVALSVMVQENGTWHEASRHDVITKAGEPVEVSGDHPAAIWCHIADDRMAAVDTQIQLTIGGGNISITTNVMQSIGTPTLVHSSQSKDGKPVKVYQTVYTI